MNIDAPRGEDGRTKIVLLQVVQLTAVLVVGSHVALKVLFLLD